MPAESRNLPCIFYVVTIPGEIASTLLDILARKFDINEIVYIINHYKTESTVSEYLRKFEAYLREDDKNSKDDGSKKIANMDDDKIYLDFKSIKDRVKVNKSSGGPAEELVSKTESFLSRRHEIYVMILVATVVALLGLVTNNVAVIWGYADIATAGPNFFYLC